MALDLFGASAYDALLQGGRASLDAATRCYGVVPAIVHEIHDAKNQRHKQGYVQVYFPWLNDDPNDTKAIKPWARCITPDVGFKMTPQKDDEVLVAFEHGDVSRPYVLGSLWNGKAEIPNPKTPGDGQTMSGHNGGSSVETPDLDGESISGGSGKNKMMFMKSREGNLICMDDKDGTIRICDSMGNARVSLEAETIKIIQSTGDIKFNAKNTISIDCENFEAHATSKIKYAADSNINIIAMSAISHSSGGSTKMSAGESFTKTSEKQVWVQANSSCNFTAGGGLTLVSTDDKTKFEAKSIMSIIATKGIEANCEGEASIGGAVVSMMSPAQVNFASSKDMKLAGAVGMFN
jgi:hypothetical protein